MIALPLAGDVINSKYRVERVLATGGMGVVLGAIHLRLHERVAIKFLKPEIAARPDAVARFMREARLSMKLHGEHVIRIFDVDVLADSLPYFVMPELEGEDLATRIAREAPLATAEIVDCMLQTCEGVAEAHALGIVHRDLKPGNLFLTHKADGSVLVTVLDFGVSKAATSFFDTDADTTPSSDPHILAARPATDAGRPDSATLTSTRAMIGSPRYMSPEQVRSSRDVDVRSDVWALGAILYEMASGEPPFAGPDLDALRADIASRPHPPLESAPARLRAIVDKCLAKDPEQRFRNVGELADALAGAGPEAMLDRAARVRSTLGVPARRRSSPWWWVATPAAAVVAVAAFVSHPAVVAPHDAHTAANPRAISSPVETSIAPSASAITSATVAPAPSSSPPRRARATPPSPSASVAAPRASASASLSADPDQAFDHPE